jgi:hypothetical protein
MGQLGKDAWLMFEAVYELCPRMAELEHTKQGEHEHICVHSSSCRNPAPYPRVSLPHILPGCPGDILLSYSHLYLQRLDHEMTAENNRPSPLAPRLPLELVTSVKEHNGSSTIAATFSLGALLFSVAPGGTHVFRARMMFGPHSHGFLLQEHDRKEAAILTAQPSMGPSSKTQPPHLLVRSTMRTVVRASQYPGASSVTFWVCTAQKPRK